MKNKRIIVILDERFDLKKNRFLFFIYPAKIIWSKYLKKNLAHWHASIAFCDYTFSAHSIAEDKTAPRLCPSFSLIYKLLENVSNFTAHLVVFLKSLPRLIWFQTEKSLICSWMTITFIMDQEYVTRGTMNSFVQKQFFKILFPEWRTICRFELPPLRTETN